MFLKFGYLDLNLKKKKTKKKKQQKSLKNVVGNFAKGCRLEN